MKVFAIADLHLATTFDKPMDMFGGRWTDHPERLRENWLETVGEEDVVLIAGDVSWAITLAQVKPDLEWIGALPGRKILIKGNHDYWHNTPAKTRAILPEGMFFLQYDAVRIGEFTFFGTRGWKTPGEPDFTPEDQKIFEREKMRLALSAEVAKKKGGRMIGLTHYPPGEEFRQIFAECQTECVVYGHLHGYFPDSACYNFESDGVRYYLTSCDYLECRPLELPL